MSDLGIENLNKSTVVLTNGLEMKKGDKIRGNEISDKPKTEAEDPKR